MIRVFVDENIPKITVSELSAKGLEVFDIRGTVLEGISDEELWFYVQKNRSLLITTDKGFSQKRYDDHYGILIVNLKLPNQAKINLKILETIEETDENFWKNNLVIVKDNTVNSRKNNK